MSLRSVHVISFCHQAQIVSFPSDQVYERLLPKIDLRTILASKREFTFDIDLFQILFGLLFCKFGAIQKYTIRLEIQANIGKKPQKTHILHIFDDILI